MVDHFALILTLKKKMTKIRFSKAQSLPEAPEGSKTLGEQHTKVPRGSPKKKTFEKLGAPLSFWGAAAADKYVKQNPKRRGRAGAASSGELRGVNFKNIDYVSKYLRKTSTQPSIPQRPSSAKPGARFARANPVFAGPLLSQISSQFVRTIFKIVIINARVIIIG